MRDSERIILAAIVCFLIAASIIISNEIKDTPVTDIEEAIVFTRALTDSPEYQECAKKNLRTIKQFKDCLKDKGAM